MIGDDDVTTFMVLSKSFVRNAFEGSEKLAGDVLWDAMSIPIQVSQKSGVAPLSRALFVPMRAGYKLES